MRKYKIRRLAAVILAAVLVAAPLSGCANVVGGSMPSGKGYSSQLRIWYDSGQGGIDPNAVLQDIAAVYQKQYPDVEVVIDTQPAGQTQTASQTQTDGADKDADIYYISDLNMSDNARNVFKEMDAGKYLDLSAIWDIDASYNLNQKVINGGYYKGHQYLVPLCYNVPILFSGEKTLDHFGFNIAKCDSPTGLFSEVSKCLKDLPADGPQNLLVEPGAYAYCLFVGPDGLIDMDKGQLIDEETFRNFCDAYKPYSAIDLQMPLLAYFDPSNPDYYAPLVRNQAPVCFVPNANLTFMAAYLALKSVDTPVVAPFPGLNGGYQAQITAMLAIRADSPNQKNAYNFVKAMLSDEAQRKISNDYGVIPVSLSAAQARLMESAQALKSYDGAYNVPRTSRPLTAEDVKFYMDILNNISSCSLVDGVIINDIVTTMSPYFGDKGTFDDCYNQLKVQLTNYMQP